VPKCQTKNFKAKSNQNMPNLTYLALRKLPNGNPSRADQGGQSGHAPPYQSFAGVNAATFLFEAQRLERILRLASC